MKSHCWNREISRKNAEKMADELTSDIIDDINKREKIIKEINEIKEKYGDERITKIVAAEGFDMTAIMLEFDIDLDTIRNALLNGLPEDDPRRNELINYINSNNIKDRFTYPGGYDAFMQDYENGIYKNIINR